MSFGRRGGCGFVGTGAEGSRPLRGSSRVESCKITPGGFQSTEIARRASYGFGNTLGANKSSAIMSDEGGSLASQCWYSVEAWEHAGSIGRR